jgi:predicted ATP-grasp superfamily ATP-dependent carboligase
MMEVITTAIRIFNRSNSLFGMISSINIFRERGATKLAILLITMSTNPIKTIFLLGHIIEVKASSRDTLGLL